LQKKKLNISFLVATSSR